MLPLLLPLLLGASGAAAAGAPAQLSNAGAPIVLDGATAHHVFDGIGGLSAGATSRLLFEYPEPQRSDILDLLFKPATAAALSILKVEIPGDVQSTDGSEPSHMHTRDDLSCARGYETWLISQAKARNPAILTYGLSWGVPRWVGDGRGNGTGFYSPDNWLYHTRWLECVRNTTGVTVDYMGTWNEKPPASTDFVIGLRAALDAAGFAGTRLSLFDGDYSTNNLVAAALASPAFNASFVSVGRHYPCDAPFPAIEASIRKAYWSSEDFSLPNDWTGASCWGKLLNQNYALMNITATIAWSLAWTAPRGLPFAGSGLLTAQEPWSGHYSGGDGSAGPSAAPSLAGPLWTTAHTTQFAAPGWRYLSVAGGGSGLLAPALGNGSYVTLVSPSGSDFALVIEKYAGPCKCKPGGAGAQGTAGAALTFATAGGLPRAGAALEVWRTNASAQFWRDADVAVAADGTFTVALGSDEAVTVSSVRGRAAHGGAAPSSIPPPAPFPLPYADDFSGYAEDATPVRRFADQQGSWAARGGSLAQVVPLDPGPNRWTAEDVDPLTLIGDPALANVTVAVTAAFEAPSAGPSGMGSGALGFVYAQVCARVSAYTGFRNGPPPGLCLGVNASGAWLVRAGGAALGSGQLPGGGSGGGGAFDPALPRALVLRAAGTRVQAWVGGALLLTADSSAYAAGLVALGSGYHSARFYNFSMAEAAAE
jgi:hypothetical protein